MDKKPTSYKYGDIFIVLSFLAFLLLSSEYLNAFPVLHLTINRQIVLLLALFLILLPAFLEFKIYIRNRVIVFLLVMRILYFGVYSLFNMKSVSHYLSYMLLISVFPIVYICISNCKLNAKRVLVCLTKISVVIIGIQVSTAFLSLVISGHALYQIKHLIAIPFGNSNTIATIVVLQSVLCFYLIKNKLFFIISTISLLFTMSRFGFFTYLCVIVISLILRSSSKHKIRNIVIYISLFLIVYYTLTNLLPVYISTYSNAISSLFNNDYSNLLNGRDDIYQFYFELISDKPILGYGLAIETPIYGLAHNFLIQSLYFGGIFGTVIYYLPYIFIIKNVPKNNNNNVDKYLLITFMIALFINGLAENVFFTAPAEYISSVYISLLIRFYYENMKDDNCYARKDSLYST